MTSPVVCGLVLAAGHGLRMGGPKALLARGGVTLVERHVRRLAEVGCVSVVVVTRPELAERVRTLLGHSRLTCKVHGEATSSQAASLAAGLRVLGFADVLVISPVDALPAAPATYRALLAALGPQLDAVTPVHAGRGGHPVVVRRSLLVTYDVALAPGAEPPPLRTVLRAARRLRLPVDDARVLGDYDRPGDLPPRVALTARR